MLLIKKIIQNVPIALTGVMLGVASLGNLLESYSETVHWICGFISLGMGIILVLKAILFPRDINLGMQNPATASVMATFSMAVITLCIYFKPYIGITSEYLWFLGIGLHLGFLILFTKRFLVKLELSRVFASYCITYAGVAVIAMTAPNYGLEMLGTAAFWFAFLAALCMLALAAYRYWKIPIIREREQPLFCVFTSPVNVCLAGYLQSVPFKSLKMVYIMAMFAFILYIMVIFHLPKLLMLPFYPSYASFTFPFVISAIAVKQTMEYLEKMKRPVVYLKYVVFIETVIAAILTCYTMLRFLIQVIKRIREMVGQPG